MCHNVNIEHSSTYINWIDAAPEHAKIEGLANWANILSSYVTSEERGPKRKAPNALRLDAYIKAFVQFAGQDWTAIGATHNRQIRNPYNTFHSLL